MKEDADEHLSELLDNASDTVKSVLYHVPYVGEALMGGELAKIAFDYLWA